MKWKTLLINFLSSIALCDSSIDVHRFDKVDVTNYHQRHPEDQYFLMEGLVLYMCITQDCAKVWEAYYQSNVWVKNFYEGAQHYGDSLQKQYLPSYAVYLAAPLCGAAVGHGEFRISHTEWIILNLKVPSLGYKLEF
jgi:hypothetical protein